MRSYTLLWNEETWNEYRSASRGGIQALIDYVAATERGIFSKILPDDELFVISIKDGQVLVGGRVVAASSPIEGRPGIMKNSPKTTYSSELKSEFLLSTLFFFVLTFFAGGA